MKTIGLIGGMSWESTSHYYSIINQEIKQRLGGFNSAKIVLVSVNFAEIEALQKLGDWQKSGELLAKAAKQLEAAGADCFLICTNTMHKVADQVAQAVNIPLLHIADATANTLVNQQLKNIALLGTAFTMSEAFYKQRLTDKFGLNVIVPNSEDQTMIHHVIYQELCLGVINEGSRKKYIRVIEDLTAQGAEAVILGCTEIGLLLSPHDTPTPLFDTTRLHALASVDFALNQ